MTLRIDRVRTRVIRWQILNRGAARGRTHRTALVVEVRTSGGVIAFGEAAPLPGASIETLAEATAAIDAFVARAPFDVEPTGAAIAQLAAATTSAPSARFAIETALLGAASATTAASAAGATSGRSIAQLLSTAPAAEVPFAVVVDDPAQARRAVEAGARCLKIKVGRLLRDNFGEPDGDLDRVVAIARAAPGIELRLDANRSWPRARVHDYLFSLAELPIEFVEEPCLDSHELLGSPLPCPIALDESLASLPHATLYAALRSPGLGAVILKPTLLGGFAACLSLAARARDAHVAVVVTHALEGPIGTAACAELALAIGGTTPVGLAPHGALAGWAVQVTQLAASSVRAAAPPDPAIVRGAVEAMWAATGERANTPAEAITRVASIDDAMDVSTDGVPAAVGYDETSRVTLASSRGRVVIATPSLQTIHAIHAALDARQPIALLHPKLPDAELARQRDLVGTATLPAGAAVILFTSGSTGPSRGVVLSRAALEAAAAASAAHLGWRDDDRWLVALPLAHAGGLSIVVRCQAAGKPFVLLEGDFDRAAVARLLDGCTLASFVPTQLAALLDDPAWRPPTSLRAVLLGGAPATPSLLAAAAARGVPFLATYGLTETFGQVATAPLARAGDPFAPLVPLPGVEIIAGSAVAPAPIRVRAPMLATQYLDGTPIAPELVTADLGVIEAGVFVVLGRADDVIITGGENVHPAMVEAVLAATPGVRSACAFAIADERWGQVVGAALAIDASFDPHGAAALWHTALPAHARPRRLATADALPLLPNGKPDRRAAAALVGNPVRYG